ncbi:MAG: hypothetical protein A3J24_10415 [Deltaproteobacteria bacterium RIFCSPLOWO2_02_FULL_53_8]|nr:MAG: hypothetical protein A3J24_10415 [Deltaproteobacteria bacterium RIFCSPLOWO2_02_FULL_53_8]
MEISYLIASALFILGLKFLSSPETARRGMFLAMIGMAIAVLGTLLHHEIINYTWILVGLIIGSVIGIPMGMVKMTAMPQRIALSHSFGALAAALVGVSEYYRHGHGSEMHTILMVAVGFEVMLGALTFTGSLIAAGKLHETIKGDWTYKGKNKVTALLLLSMIAMLGYLIYDSSAYIVFYMLIAVAFAFGVQLVMPIGAADMPVVISILNSYAGLAGSATGFVISNKVLIIAGALDGASGIILSIIMCKAMNRSAANVFFGGLGTGSAAPAPSPIKAPVPAHVSAVAAPAADAGPVVKKITPEETALMFRDAKRIIVVPGYGLAAAQAQHVVGELAGLLKDRNIEVKYAIHPVAGRMPGHMNVLLAEAGIPYTDLIEMEEINDEFPHTDVALVIGANDITNPAARYDTQSPIYGMPILDVDKARNIIVCKRSMKPGFAGIDNELYLHKNTKMLFGDAKDAISKVVGAIKDPNLKPAPVVEEAASNEPSVKKVSPEQAAAMFKNAKRVIVVPGYGMAAAQAQHAVGEFAEILKGLNVSVKYAIHPVAGRMPGHMNVLLAEAGIPYTDLIEMEEINDEFEETDIALVIGANDITNPAARYDTQSPIYGMPILNVDKAKSIIVCKRSMKPGFAGIDNELYLHKNTKMLFGDAKDSIMKVVQRLKG